ncbi:MAG: NfeD family protein [Sulfuricurvum sp.]|uniref:NfeD family protein n=2 Tax=Sulfuricurvum sp. TaxID=2025608 RepID=UPI002614A0BA|nr:NfeD family protein [Sulfuricurvum sp.]MDD2838767.1 NfeD family protein [Sulfuricurvum sp.]MDD3597678.1 NfeD family protein [Sulfuricurvum sp.]
MSYYIWLILGVLAFVIEMMLPTFFALFAGVGFISAALVAFWLPESLFWQLVIAAVFMIIGAVVFKKRGVGDDERDTVGTHNEFVGILGVAITPLSPHREGEIELYEPIVGTRRWPAITEEGDIDIQTEVRVVKLNGNTVVVEKTTLEG